ncbi:MAG: PLP-dependent aspartate aminotransferase family protein [Pseudomonadota bacterium]
MINDPKGSTIAAKAGHFLDVHSGAVTPEIQTSTTFARDDRYDLINAANGYIRDQNPTFVHAERVLADLENGEECLLFSSGMAAIAAVFYTLRPGSHVVIPDSMYWGVSSFLADHCERADILVSTYSAGDAQSIEPALKSQNHTSVVWLETPSNPFMHVTDIALAAEITHDYGALLCVDSTVATPVFTKPLDHGADVVIHSATKYLNGHSDVLCGAIVTREEHPLWQAVKKERGHAGAQPGSFDAWLLLRGLRTLYVRVRQASQNAASIARFLEQHAAVESVAYPGLESHPGHQIASAQMDGGYGALLSFSVKGDRERTLQVAGRLQLITSATSLGGVESLIEHRHSIEPAENAIPENQLRLSVGIEDVDDLIADLDSALNR